MYLNNFIFNNLSLSIYICIFKLDPSVFSLKDAQGEKHYKLSLETSLTISKIVKLFDGWKFQIKYQDLNEDFKADDLKSKIP